jgi:hypothetical protein
MPPSGRALFQRVIVLAQVRAGKDRQAGSSIENDLLVDPSVGIVLVHVRAIDARRQRQYGHATGEGEGDGHERDELSHGGLLCPLLRRGLGAVTVTLGGPAGIERDAAHNDSILFRAAWKCRPTRRVPP